MNEQHVYRRRLQFEVLEDRVMLSVAQDLANSISPYQSALSSALNVATQLPLVGRQLTDLSEFTTVLQNTESLIDSQTTSITNNGHYQITVPLPTLTKTFSFNLGLDAFLQATAAGSVQASIHPTLYIGFDVNNGSASLDLDQTRFDIGFDLSLPGFQGSFSFNQLLYAHAVDQGTNFSGVLGFEFAAGGGLDATFSGQANVLMGLSLSFVDPALNASFNPTFRTTLDLDWGFGANNQLATPSIQLVNFGLDADSFLHGFMGDIVKTVQKYTKPIQPFIDIFETPVPIVSAFGSSETFGTLLLKGAGLSQVQQDRFTFMLYVIRTINTIDLSGSTQGAVIPFGTIVITGNAQQTGSFGFDTSQLATAIDDVLNNPALQEVKDTITKVANYAGLTSTAGFKFPLLENPQPVIGAILTGQTETMFSYSTGRQHFELAPSVGVGIKDLFGVFLTAGIVFDTNLSMGYDTAGLIALAQDPTHNPAKLLHGFYFDNSIDATAPPIPNHPPLRQTGLYLDGFMELSGSVIATLSGGLYANINVELVSTDLSSHVHLDTMLANLNSSGKIFKLSGKVHASADISVTFPNPIGPDITAFSYNLAYDEVLNFDPPPPPNFSLPVTVVDVTNQHTLLLDVSKMGVNSLVRVEPFHDITVPAGFAADGIRVDYPNEIVLYVERKNDANSNYYNLISLNGAVPDGVTIQVMDPFRVFYDEGAPDPTPTQTKPGVLLVGGKSVVYRYAGVADGTQPNVLMVGGYGSNTLSGGTMTFGNFIPADRIAQAKAHFGNTTGFDGAGQGLINSVIDAAISPANPAGIIGATMTGSRGGLMFGGPGNNSFYAAGPGTYEMIGGSWIDSFSISPSFNGGVATYQIDGGPGGDNGLVVRVPPGDLADFENGTAPDKYNPAFKALDIHSNAGLFTTAHGIQKVLAVGAPGSTIVFGDTSELDIEFSARGSGTVKFGGSPAPDDFDVSTRYQVHGLFAYGTRHRRPTTFLYPSDPYHSYDFNNGLGGFYDFVDPAPPQYSFSVEGPIYSISRTFGTNNRTQVIELDVNEVDSTSIVLDGRGASDQYRVAMGLGTFVDITVDDTDETTQNDLTVDARQVGLLYERATLTDDELRLQYYTPILEAIVVGYYVYLSAVTYSPTIHFDANTDVTFGMATLFHTVVDRPTATQHARILVDGLISENIGFGFGHTNWVYDRDQPNPTLFKVTPTSVIDVLANAGGLTVESVDLNVNPSITVNVHGNTGSLACKETIVWSGYYDTYNIFGNSGSITIEEYISGSYGQSLILGLTHEVNVLANSGTINLHDYIHPSLIHYPGALDTQVKVGSGAGLANVHGTINLSNASVLLVNDPEAPVYSAFGRYGLLIDDRNNPGAVAPWIIDTGKTQIGDLTVNHIDKGFPGRYEAFTKTGSHVTLFNFPRFSELQFNGGSFPSLTFTGSFPSARVNTVGDAVSTQLSPSGNAGQPVAWAASNLPPGLSIDQSGLISGIVSAGASQANPYPVVVTITLGDFSRARTTSWYVSSGIAGDYDGDGVVGSSDYSVWRSNFGNTVTAFTLGDGSGDRRVDAADYVVWRKNLGATAPPAVAAASVIRAAIDPAPVESQPATAATAVSSAATDSVFASASTAEFAPSLRTIQVAISDRGRRPLPQKMMVPDRGRRVNAEKTEASAYGSLLAARHFAQRPPIDDSVEAREEHWRSQWHPADAAADLAAVDAAFAGVGKGNGLGRQGRLEFHSWQAIVGGVSDADFD